jgi:hypothetical protein
MWVKIGVRLASPEVEPRYWIILAEWAEGDFESGWGGVDGPPRHRRVEGGDDDQDQPMFVRVDELVENAETVGKRSQPRVWLYGYQSIDDVLVGDAARAQRLGVAFVVSGFPEADGEVVLFRPLTTFEYRELKVQVVEGRTEIREEVAQDRGPLGVYDGESFYPVDILRWFTVKFTADKRTIEHERGINALLEVTGVETGSREFQMYPFERSGDHA